MASVRAAIPYMAFYRVHGFAGFSEQIAAESICYKVYGATLIVITVVDVISRIKRTRQLACI